MWKAIRFSLLYAEYAALVHQARWMQEKIRRYGCYGRRPSSHSLEAEVLLRQLEEVARSMVSVNLPALSRGLQECVDHDSADRARLIIDKTLNATKSLDQLVGDLQSDSRPSLLTMTLQTGIQGVHLSEFAISRELEPITSFQQKLDFGSPIYLISP